MPLEIRHVKEYLVFGGAQQVHGSGMAALRVSFDTLAKCEEWIYAWVPPYKSAFAEIVEIDFDSPSDGFKLVLWSRFKRTTIHTQNAYKWVECDVDWQELK